MPQTANKSRRLRRVEIDSDLILRIRNAKSDSLLELASIAGLDVKTDFRYADLRGVSAAELEDQNIDLTGSILDVKVQSTSLGRNLSGVSWKRRLFLSSWF